LTPFRVGDWLRLLGFQQESSDMLAFRPPLRRALAPGADWLEGAGSRYWPIFGGVFAVKAVKRVPARIHRLRGLDSRRRCCRRGPRSRRRGAMSDVTDTGASPAAVEIFTDGACKGNPGPGGWGAVLRWGAHEKELCGGEPQTTNNRMELMAVIQALEALTRPTCTVVSVDSRYVQDGVESWMPRWKRNGWQTRERKPVKNQDLWQRLDQALSPDTACAGAGSRATAAIPRTSAPTSSRIAAFRRAGDPPRAGPVGRGRLAAPVPLDPS
jgi:ribonuclease HI